MNLRKILLSNKINNIVLLLLGLFLCMFPAESINITGYVIAGVLCVGGLSNFIYFLLNRDERVRMDYLYLILSLIIFIIGIYTFINPTWIVTVINVFIGALIIVYSVINIINLFKFKVKDIYFWLFLVISVLILVLGIIAIINPLELASLIVRLEGLSLIVDTIITIIIMNRLSKMLLN